MIELTKGDHFEFGWGGGLFNSADDKEFRVHFGRARREPLSWREECILAAREIGIRAGGKKLVLACSNGWDSEVMFHSFRLAGVPFEVAVAELEHRLNWHDVSYVYEICAQHGVRIQTYKLDILQFIEERMHTYADAYRLTMPAMTMQLWLLDQIDGLPVFGSGDVHLARKRYTAPIYGDFEPHRTVLGRRLKEQGREGFPFFFVYTPEMMLAYLEHPLTKVFLRSSFSLRIGKFLRFRHPTYVYSFPEMGPQRLNGNGWELVRPYYEQARRALEKKHLAANQPCHIPYWDLVRMLSHDPSRVPEDAVDPPIEASQLDPDLWPQKDCADDTAPR